MAEIKKPEVKKPEESKLTGTRKVGETHSTINTEVDASNEKQATKNDPNVSADNVSEDEKIAAHVPDAYMVNAAQFYTTSSPSKNVRLDDITSTRIVPVEILVRELMTRADILENRYELIEVFTKALTDYFESEKPYYYRGFEGQK